MAMASENEITEDFLEVDQKIPGQNFVCLSFISPENVLQDKNKYFMSNFFKYVFQSGDKTIQDRLSNEALSYDELSSVYDDWLYTRQDELEKEFYEKNDFKTSVRGIKVRGVYETVKEANIRAKILQKRDPSFHVFVGQVGYWLPWDPESDKIENQEYQEQHLNELVKNYKQNLEERDEFYEQVKQDKLKKAKEELAKAKEELEKQKPSNDNTPAPDVSKENIEQLRDIMDTRDKALAEQKEQNAAASAAPAALEGTQVTEEALLETDPWMAQRSEGDAAEEPVSASVLEEGPVDEVN